MRLFKEEGYAADSDDFLMQAAAMCAYHSDCDSAKRWTTAALKARVAEFGDKSLRADEIRETLRNPRSGEGAGHRIEIGRAHV